MQQTMSSSVQLITDHEICIMFLFHFLGGLESGGKGLFGLGEQKPQKRIGPNGK